MDKIILVVLVIAATLTEWSSTIKFAHQKHLSSNQRNML